MDRNFHTFHMILHIDNDAIIFTDLNAWPWNHAIGGQDTTFNTIGKHALAMTPNGIRSIWCAHLTGAVNGEEECQSGYIIELFNRFLIALEFETSQKSFLGIFARSSNKYINYFVTVLTPLIRCSILM